jgi:uncharacterized Tic20 family protein
MKRLDPFLPLVGIAGPVALWYVKVWSKVVDLFAAGALGYSLDLMFLLIERRFVHWSGK